MLTRYEWPFLAIGQHEDYLTFAGLRSLSPLALISATALDTLFFHTDSRTGQRLCTITDDTRYVRQDRCVDGGQVQLAGGGLTKSRTIGTASWPVGAAKIKAKRCVLLVEGMPDLLAAVQVIGGGPV